MKRLILLLLIFAGVSEVSAQKKDSVRFVYVVQNPLMFGNNARAWFEIEGLQDIIVAAKINDTLRKVFFEKTEFDTFDMGWATMRSSESTPKGYTDFSFSNGQTYGNGWIRFKNSDSTVRLTQADGYYGSGKNLGGFSQEVAQGRLAWIGIYALNVNENGIFYNRSIDLAFDLRTGNIVPHGFIVRIDPAKKDSLEKVLYEKVNKEINNEEMHVTGVITHAYHLSDTVIVPMSQLIRWINNKQSGYMPAVSRYYDTNVITNNQNSQRWRRMAYLMFDEAVPFFLKEDWSKLLAL